MHIPERQKVGEGAAEVGNGHMIKKQKVGRQKGGG